MAKYSKGPWYEGGELIVSEDNKIVARISYAHHGRDHVQDHQESEANRKLIKAATQMLAMLEEIADDSRVDLCRSERRMRLYQLIQRAGGHLAGGQP